MKKRKRRRKVVIAPRLVVKVYCRYVGEHSRRRDIWETPEGAWPGWAGPCGRSGEGERVVRAASRRQKIQKRVGNQNSDYKGRAAGGKAAQPLGWRVQGREQCMSAIHCNWQGLRDSGRTYFDMLNRHWVWNSCTSVILIFKRWNQHNFLPALWFYIYYWHSCNFWSKVLIPYYFIILVGTSATILR